MIKVVNIADLPDPSNPDGRTYRVVNSEKRHNINIGSLVELGNGCRLLVVKHTRDCDMTPLYSLAPDMDGLEFGNMFGWSHGYSEESLSLIQPPTEEDG